MPVAGDSGYIGRMIPRGLPLRIRVVFAVVSVVLFMALSEAVLRVAHTDTYFQNRFFTLNRALDYPEVFKKDRTLFWRLREGQTVTSKFFEGRTYRINSLGLRGEEVASVKTARRVLTLGNSCTFGWGVPYQSTFSARLEPLLGTQYETINGGIPGYSSFQGRRFFERELIHLKPDIVIIMFGWNDHWAAASGIPDKEQRFPPELVLEVQNELSRLHSYRLLKKLLLSLLEKDPDSLFDRAAPVYRVGLDDFRSNLHAICRTVQGMGATPIMVTSPAPSLPQDGRDVWWAPAVGYHARYNEVVRELARSAKVVLVDAARAFEGHEGLYDDPFLDFIHFNASGHELVATLLAQAITSIDSSPPTTLSAVTHASPK